MNGGACLCAWMRGDMVEAVLHSPFYTNCLLMFSLVETGRWQSSSNDILLNNMVVFPEKAKAWIIGDGYCSNPSGWEPYDTWKRYHGF